MFEKCQQIVETEKQAYDLNLKKDPSIATKYAFPKHKLKPLMYYWEEKCQTFLLKIIDAKPFQKEWFGMLSLGLGNKLQDLITQKYDQLPNFEEIYRKNFKKSLDHRSFQYKEFIKKF